MDASFYLAFGIAFLFWPGPLAQLSGIALDAPSGFTDIRATYGGLEVGTGMFLIYCASAKYRIRIGLIACLFSLCGFGGARLLGIILDGQPTLAVQIYLGIEFLGVILNTAALGLKQSSLTQS